MTSMWSLFGQVTHIPTKALHSPLLSVFPSRRKLPKAEKGGCVCAICWHRLTRKRQSRGRGTKRHTKKAKKLCRKYSSCSSSFPLESGKTWCTPLAWKMWGHMITRPRYSEVYGSSEQPGVWKETNFLTAKFSKHAAWTWIYSAWVQNVFSTLTVRENLPVPMISTVLSYVHQAAFCSTDTCISLILTACVDMKDKTCLHVDVCGQKPM